MINRNNIVAYIAFLYRKRLNQPAPQELLDSWTGLSDNDTIIHLNGLYRHWNLDTITAKKYEEEFLSLNRYQNPVTNTGTATPVTPAMPAAPQKVLPKVNIPKHPGYSAPSHYTSPASASTENTDGVKGKGWLLATLILIILAAAAFYWYQLDKVEPSVSAAVKATDSANLNVVVPEPVSTPIQPKEQEETEADKINARAIQDLFFVESKRNFDEIYAFFDPNMERYWDINYPTYEELRARYEETWSNSENNEYQNVRVKKVAPNTYDVMSTYSYFSLKDEQQKRILSKVRFVFNDNNKIVKTYGL